MGRQTVGWQRLLGTGRLGKAWLSAELPDFEQGRRSQEVGLGPGLLGGRPLPPWPSEVQGGNWGPGLSLLHLLGVGSALLIWVPGRRNIYLDSSVLSVVTVALFLVKNEENGSTVFTKKCVPAPFPRLFINF